MIINKIVQELAKNVSAKSNIRPTLASVFFTKNKAVATDSFKLCEIEFLQNEFTQKDLELKDFEYKKFDESILLSKDDFLKIEIPKLKNIDQLNKVFISSENQWEVELKSFDTEKYQTIKTTTHKWNFPDYEVFFPKESSLEIWFCPKYMIELLKVYEKAWVRSIKMKLWTPLDPIVIEAHNSDDQLEKHDIKQIKSIIMPIKL